MASNALRQLDGVRAKDAPSDLEELEAENSRLAQAAQGEQRTTGQYMAKFRAMIQQANAKDLRDLAAIFDGLQFVPNDVSELVRQRDNSQPNGQQDSSQLVNDLLQQIDDLRRENEELTGQVADPPRNASNAFANPAEFERKVELEVNKRVAAEKTRLERQMEDSKPEIEAGVRARLIEQLQENVDETTAMLEEERQVQDEKHNKDITGVSKDREEVQKNMKECEEKEKRLDELIRQNQDGVRTREASIAAELTRLQQKNAEDLEKFKEEMTPELADAAGKSQQGWFQGKMASWMTIQESESKKRIDEEIIRLKKLMGQRLEADVEAEKTRLQQQLQEQLASKDQEINSLERTKDNERSELRERYLKAMDELCALRTDRFLYDVDQRRMKLQLESQQSKLWLRSRWEEARKEVKVLELQSRHWKKMADGLTSLCWNIGFVTKLAIRRGRRQADAIEVQSEEIRRQATDIADLEKLTEHWERRGGVFGLMVNSVFRALAEKTKLPLPTAEERDRRRALHAATVAAGGGDEVAEDGVDESVIESNGARGVEETLSGDVRGVEETL